MIFHNVFITICFGNENTLEDEFSNKNIFGLNLFYDFRLDFIKN